MTQQKQERGTMTVSEMGRRGGHARARALTAAQRKAVSRKAIRARNAGLTPDAKREMYARAKATRCRNFNNPPPAEMGEMRQVAHFRGRGYTYAQISAAMDIPTARAKQIYRAAYQAGIVD